MIFNFKAQTELVDIKLAILLQPETGSPSTGDFPSCFYCRQVACLKIGGTVEVASFVRRDGAAFTPDFKERLCGKAIRAIIPAHTCGRSLCLQVFWSRISLRLVKHGFHYPRDWPRSAD